MSAPMIWIFAPAAIAAVLLALSRHKLLVVVAGTLALVVLAWFAWKIPIDQSIRIGPMAFRVSDTFDFLGRRFVLASKDRPLLVLIYLLAACWFAGSFSARVNALFIPIGLGMVAFFVAALAVEPFLYAALLIEMAVLASIPMLSPPGETLHQGVIRYLIFQTMALPFILFTGWMLTGLEAGSTDVSLPLRAGVLLGLGFALLLALFPFYSWIPMLAEQNHPYVAGFVLLILPTVIQLFGVDFLDQYTWLRESPLLPEVLRYSGVIMVITGGVGAAFQKHLGRMMGYSVIVETGFSVIALSLGGQTGLPIFSMLFLPRILGFGVWALSLSVVKNLAGSLDFSAVASLGRRYPIVVAGMLLSQFSIAGLPLLAGFPVKLALIEALAGQGQAVSLWVLAGTAGLLAAGVRTLAVLTQGTGWSYVREVPWYSEMLLVAGSLALLLVGLLPQVFSPFLLSLVQTFSRLAS